MDYLSYRDAWKHAELGELKPELYLGNTLWRSMLTEEEINQVVAFIQAVYNARTFTDFLKVVEWTPENFAYVFDRDVGEVLHWARRESVFPVRMKQTYGFMLLTYQIAYGRQHICSRCGEAFLSMKDAIYCDRCCEIIQKAQKEHEKMENDANTVKLQIEVICNSEVSTK